MKKLILFVFVLVVGNVRGQQWIDAGATWYYGFENWGTLGYYKVVYESDTIIDGKACQQLGTYVYNYQHVLPQNIYFYISTESRSKFYTYSSGDTVFFQNEDFYPGFHVLINYNAQLNDSWSIGFNNSTFPCADSTEIIDSIGTITINGQELRWLHLSNEFIHVFGLWGQVIERIGNVDHFLLPSYRSCNDGVAIEFDNINFRCFFDNSFPLYNPSGQPCDFPLTVGLTEYKSTTDNLPLKLFPNPATEKIAIELPPNAGALSSVVISDIAGNVVASPLTPLQGERGTIDVSTLSPGIYFVLAETDKAVFRQKLIKQ